jgi:hypothetical protein
MSSDDERQARRNTLMLKHRKRTGGFVPAAGHSRLRSLYSRCRIDPALDIFLFKPKKRKVRTYD